MRGALLILALLIVGCATNEPANPPPTNPTDVANTEPGWFVVDATPAAEPDLVVLPTGRVLLCSLPQRASSDMLIYASDDGANYTRLPSAGTGLIDCALGVDAAGKAYYVTSAGPTLTTASTQNGETWDHKTTIGAGAYDRPWIAGGEGARAVIIAYDAKLHRIVAFATRDGAASWSAPTDATPTGELVFQTFGNLVWLGHDSYAFAYGRLAPQGAALEMRGIRLALTLDGGASWRSEDVTAAPRAGNANHIFPSTAVTTTGEVLVAWAESASDDATDVWLARGQPGAWSPPVRVNRDGTTALIPEVVSLNDGTSVVAMYETTGRLNPSAKPASWNMTAYVGSAPRVLQAGAHNGTINTGGYGTLPSELTKGNGEGTPNSNELLHNLGSGRAADGRVILAWTTSTAGPRVLAAWL